MSGFGIGTAPASATGCAVDALVARYAVIGAEQRRKRKRARVVKAAGAAAAAGLGLAVWLADVDFADLQPGLRDLRTRLGAELDAYRASATKLEMQQARLEQRSDELSSRLTDFERVVASLESERTDIRSQSARVDEALGRIETERQALLAALQSAPMRPAPQADARDAALAASGQAPAAGLDMDALARQSRVAGDLGELERRRDALHARRAELEARRRELEAMLAEARPVRDDDEAVVADVHDRDSFVVASAVTPETLGGMRGGIMLGNGMNVSIGLTRSASVNGIDQASSTFRMDGLSRGLSAAPLPSFEPVVIQAGSGNWIDSGLLGAASGFGTLVQNSLDNQVIDTRTIYDVSITDVSKAMDGVAAGQALRDSLYFQQ